VEILKGDTWMDLQIVLLGKGIADVDIAVLSPAIQLSPPYRIGQGGLQLLGQDVFFLGFPYGLRMPSTGLNRGFDFPLVKKATISSLCGSPGEPQYMLLDGINNPGFSGGPVVSPPGGLSLPQITSGEMKLEYLGVISSYRFEWESAYERNQKTSLAVKTNTGIIIAYDIKHAFDIIDHKPDGFPLEQSKADE
jgi:hypothetical protein